MDRRAAVDRILALDRVVGDLLGHQVGAGARRLLLGLELGRALREPVRLVLLGVGHLHEAVDLAGELLDLHLRFQDRGRLDALVPVVGREEKIEDLGLEGVALGPGDVDDRGGAAVIGEALHQIRVVAALVLGGIGEPALLDEAAPGDAVLRFGLESVDHGLHDVLEGTGVLAVFVIGLIIGHARLTAGEVDYLSRRGEAGDVTQEAPTARLSPYKRGSSMRLAAALMATILLGSPALGAKVSDKDRFQLWNACRPMGLSVDGRSDPADLIGPIKKDVIVTARARLRAADLYTELFQKAAGAFLNVKVEVVGNDIAGDAVRAAVHVQVSYAKFMTDSATMLEHFLPSWQTGTVGTYGRGPMAVHRVVAKLTDEFIAEYLRVNAAACEK